MIIDLKYHITSIAAIFLALAIGIVTGSVMLGNDTLVWQQERLTDNLESQLTALRQENRQLEAKAENLDNAVQKRSQFEQSVLAELVASRLEGTRIALIDTCNSGLGEELSQLLTMAGAKVVSSAVINEQFSGVEERAKLKRYLGLSQATEEQVTAELSRQLAQGVVFGANQTVLKMLRDNHLVTITDVTSKAVTGRVEPLVEPQGPARAPAVKEPAASVTVLLIGDCMETDRKQVKAELVDVPIMDYLTGQGIKVVGVEPVNTGISYIPYFSRFNLTSVDNIDTIPGQLALVRALAGRPGRYGVKETAESFLPLNVPD